MAEYTKIEWAHHSHNFWIGCTAVSPACDHCYADDLTTRYGGDFSVRRRTAPATWKHPFRWNKRARAAGIPERVFSCSMADFFDNKAPIEWFVDALDVIRETPSLIWMLLTKRPQNIVVRLRQAFDITTGPLHGWISAWLLGGIAPANIWLGTTVENQEEADRRIPHLLCAPAHRRFLSCEPLLGRVDVRWAFSRNILDVAAGILKRGRFAPGMERLRALDWAICGGESGPKFRRMDMDHARDLLGQCHGEGRAFFMKQASGTKKADLQNIPADLMVREFPA